MVSRWPKRPRINRSGVELGTPKYAKGERVGSWTILMYQGHSYVNKRNAKEMSKTQHWYRVRCSCGKTTSRSQQELIDPRRQQCCADCHT